jgi:hypothetical protein
MVGSWSENLPSWCDTEDTAWPERRLQQAVHPIGLVVLGLPRDLCRCPAADLFAFAHEMRLIGIACIDSVAAIEHLR